jgi:hypothetical protein
MQRSEQTDNILRYRNLIAESERDPAPDEVDAMLPTVLTNKELQNTKTQAEPFSAALLITALTVGA